MSMIDAPAAAAPHPEGRVRWHVVVSLMLIYSYAFVDRVVLSLLVDPIKHDLGATDTQMGLLLGLAFALCYGIFTIPSGHFADRMNRRRLIAFSSVGWALMTIVCGLTTSVTELFIARAGVGLMEAVIAPAAYSLIRDTVPARSRGLAFSTYAMAPLLGGAASLGGGGLLLKHAIGGAFAGVPLIGGLAPWRETLVIVGLLGMPLSLLLLTFREPPRDVRGIAPGRGIIAGLADACRYLARHGALYAPLLAFAVAGAMMSFSFNSWFPAAVGRRFAMPPQQVGPILGMLYLSAGVFGLIAGGFIMNALTRRGGSVMSYALVAVIGTALGTSSACLVGTPTLAFTCVGVGILFLGISNPAGATKLSEVTPPEMIGRISAVYLLLQTLLGQTLGPLAVGFAGQHLFSGPSSIAQGLVVVQLSCGAIAVICAVLILRQVRSGSAKPRG